MTRLDPKWTPRLACALGALAFAGASWAVDGVVLIDQAKVNAAGGFPYKISQPGSYRLAGNLTIADANTNVIEIKAPNVTLDLNGFTLSGPNVCDLAASGMVKCSLPGSGAGVRAMPTAPVASSAIAVVNGSIRGMGGPAIDLISAATDTIRVSGITAIGNGFGIYVGGLATVNSNVVNTNQGAGVRVGGASLVMDNVIGYNGGVGLMMLTNTASIGYARNVITANAGGNVVGGVAIGPNACDNNLTCP